MMTSLRCMQLPVNVTPKTNLQHRLASYKRPRTLERVATAAKNPGVTHDVCSAGTAPSPTADAGLQGL